MSEQFGPYELLRKVAQGGMAEVFLARHQGKIGGFSKQLAIKRIYPHLAADPELIAMFIDEARIAARLNHPNVVQIYDLGEIDGYFYIAMEFVQGCDLRSLCERSLDMGSFLPMHLACRVVADAAAGLHYAHTRLDDSGQPMNIIHRDISPQNILIGMNGNIKLCDFGIAKAEERLTSTRTGQFKGKFAYMSPEQVMGSEEPLDARADLFCLGIVLYEITTISRLFRGKNDYETIKLVGEMEILPPSQIAQNFPPDLEAIILKALQRNPNDRFQSAEAFQLALEEWLVDHRAKATPLHVARFMQEILPEQIESETSALLSMPEYISDQILSTPKTSLPQPPAPGGLEEPTETSELIDDMVMADATADINVMNLRAALNTDISEHTYPGAQSHTPAPRDRNMTPMGSHNVVAQTLSPQLQLPPHATQLPTQVPAPVEPQSTQPILEPSIPVARHPQVSGQHPAQQRHHQLSGQHPSLQRSPQLSGQHPAMTRPPRPTGPHRAAQMSGAHPAQRKAHPTAAQQAAPTPAPVETAPTPEFNAPEPVGDDTMASMEFDMGALQRKDRRKKLAIAFVGLLAMGGIIAFVWSYGDKRDVPTPKAKPKFTDKQLATPKPKPLDRLSIPVNSSPDDAILVVNGKVISQRTPTKLNLVQDKLNEVIFYKDGHLAHRLLLKPKSGQKELTVMLEKAEAPDPEVTPTSLILSSTPAGAQIFHNGLKIGQTPHRIQSLDPEQEHHFLFKKDDHYSYATLTRLTSEKENKLVAQLPPKSLKSYEDRVDVIFDIVPKDTLISINGEKKGLSKTTLKLQRGTFAQLKFQKKDTETMERAFEVDHVGVFVYHPFLTAIVREKATLSVSVSKDVAVVYIGNQSYRPEQLKRLSLMSGTYPVIVETQDSQRLSSSLVLQPKKLNRVSLKIDDGKLVVSTK